MSKEERKVPELRFKGFHDDWEQRKLGMFYDFKNGLNKGKEFFGSGTPIVNFTDVFHNRRIYSKNLLGTVNLTENEISRFKVKKGDLFFTRTSETINQIGYPSVLIDETKDTVFSGFLLRGRAIKKDPLADTFKSYVFFTESFRREMITKSSMTTRALTTGSALKGMSFNFPKNCSEQCRIGDLLINLDQVIELHQRKHHILGKLYSTFVDKVYPEKDKNTPMLRFNNYNREWDKTKLELLLEEFTIKSNVENEYQILSSTNTGMEFRNGRVSGKSNKGYKIIKNGDLVLSPQNLWLGNININNLGTGLVSPSYKTFHVNKGDGEFLEPQLHTKRMLNTFENVSTQGASVVRRNLDIDLFNQIIIKTPQNDEKAEISNLLISIKTLNKFYEKKLKYLQTIKKEYLRKMFL